MVAHQATTIVWPVRQFTILCSSAAPTPMIDPTTIWVVDTGAPNAVAASREVLEANIES